MSRSSTLILLGLLVVFTPFSGLPVALRTFMLVLFGACIAAFGYLMRTREIPQKRVEAQPTQEEPVTVSPPQISSI